MNNLQRERFEKWASQYDYDLTWSELIDNYNFSVTRILFDTWCAAIESVVVELPVSAIIFGEKVVRTDAVKKSLDKAGIKYE